MKRYNIYCPVQGLINEYPLTAKQLNRELDEMRFHSEWNVQRREDYPDIVTDEFPCAGEPHRIETVIV